MLSLEISSSKHKRLFDQQQQQHQSPPSTPPAVPSSPGAKGGEEAKLAGGKSPNVTILNNKRLFDPHLQTSSSSKRRSSWRNLLTPSYKSRSDEFHKLFCDKIPKSERLIADYACALHREILIQGRVYISINYIAFYSNLFSWITKLVVKLRDVSEIYKANTARIIPNAIQLITTSGEKHVFASFVARDKSYIMMLRIWQNNLMNERMSDLEIKNLVHFSYGKDLGMNENEELKINSPDPLVGASDGEEDREEEEVSVTEDKKEQLARKQPPRLKSPLSSSPSNSDSSATSSPSTFSSSSPLLLSPQPPPPAGCQTKPNEAAANSNSLIVSSAATAAAEAEPAEPPSPPSAPPNSLQREPNSYLKQSKPNFFANLPIEENAAITHHHQLEIVDGNNNQHSQTGSGSPLASSKSESSMIPPIQAVLRRSKTTPKFERPAQGKKKVREELAKESKGHTRSNSFENFAPAPPPPKWPSGNEESKNVIDNLVSKLNELSAAEAAGSSPAATGSGRRDSGSDDYSPAVMLETPASLRNRRKLPETLPNGNLGQEEQESLNTSQGDEFVGLNARVDGEDLVELTTSCDCKSHSGQLIADKEFDLNVDTLFTLIFTNSKFMRSYMIRRGMMDAFVSNWRRSGDRSNTSSLSRGTSSQQTGSEQLEREQQQLVRIKQVRQLNYSMMLNHLLAKQVDIEERQNICQAKPGVYVLKSQTINSGVPYGETFTVDISYCLTRNGDLNKSRMLVHGFVNFKKEKQNWKLAMVKSMIEKQSLNGLNEYIADLSACVRDYIEETIQKAAQGEGQKLEEALGVEDEAAMATIPAISTGEPDRTDEQTERISLKSISRNPKCASFTPLGSRKSSFSSSSSASSSHSNKLFRPSNRHKKTPSVTTLYSLLGPNASEASQPLPAAAERAGQKWDAIGGRFLIWLLLSMALLLMASSNLLLLNRLDSLELHLKQLEAVCSASSGSGASGER